MCPFSFLSLALLSAARGPDQNERTFSRSQGVILAQPWNPDQTPVTQAHQLVVRLLPKGWKQLSKASRGVKVICIYVLSRFSRVWLFPTSWTVAHQVPLSMGFSRQEYWNGLPCFRPGELPDPGVEPAFLMSPVLAGRFFTSSVTWEAHQQSHVLILYSEYKWFTYCISSNSTTDPLQYLLFKMKKTEGLPWKSSV